MAAGPADGPAAGSALIDEVEAGGALDGYPYLHAARADLLRRRGRFADARMAYERAPTLR